MAFYLFSQTISYLHFPLITKFPFNNKNNLFMFVLQSLNKVEFIYISSIFSLSLFMFVCLSLCPFLSLLLSHTHSYILLFTIGHGGLSVGGGEQEQVDFMLVMSGGEGYID